MVNRHVVLDNGRIMATAEQLKALLRSHAVGDDRHFFAVAMQVAAHEAKQGHGRLAEELRELIDAAKARRSANGLTSPIPLSRNSLKEAQVHDFAL